MTVFELYSQRRKRETQTEPDVYRYDVFPPALRGQIEHIWNDAIGPYYQPSEYGFGREPEHNNRGWEAIHKIVCRERGVQALVRGGGGVNARADFVAAFYGEADVDKVLDLVEISFRYVRRIVGDMNEFERQNRGITCTPDEAIEELNYRLREAAV